MRDELLDYYERELTYLRRTGAEFARRYPKVAGRLLLEQTKCDDPHVERLLEGFAFLAARVHLKIDDDFSEISEALLNVVYPHYIRPVPSMSLVQFHLDPDQGKLTGGLRIPRGSQLYSRPVGGMPCKFTTCYDTTIWPLQLNSARWLTPHELKPPVRSAEATSALRLELQGLPGVAFNQLDLTSLRFHISADANLSAIVYELLCNNCVSVVLRDLTPGSRAAPVVLPASAVQPVGFGEHDGLIPYPRRSFLGYRLLQEYFVFPEKFFFIDVAGFDQKIAARKNAHGARGVHRFGDEDARDGDAHPSGCLAVSTDGIDPATPLGPLEEDGRDDGDHRDGDGGDGDRPDESTAELVDERRHPG